MSKLHKRVHLDTVKSSRYRNIITDKFTHPLCHVCCRIPTHLGHLAVVILFEETGLYAPL